MLGSPLQLHKPNSHHRTEVVILAVDTEDKMTQSRSPRKPIVPKRAELFVDEETEQKVEERTPELEPKSAHVIAPEPVVSAPQPTGKIFLGDEDKKLLKKFNKEIVKILNLGQNRSFKV